MNFIEALKLGLVKGFSKPERHIETWLSDVFLYKKNALKIVKYVSNKDFGDFTDFETRKKFYQDDFAWNNLFAPEIYVDLLGIKKDRNGNWIILKVNKRAEDYCILMRRINPDDTLINRLYQRKVTKKDLKLIVEKLLVNLEKANKKYLKKQSHFLNKNVHELMSLRLDNFQQFILGVEEIPKKITKKRIKQVVSFYERQKYFKHIKKENVSLTIDAHSANVIFIKNKPVFMDVYWPMPVFRIIDRALAIARLAACVRIFMGDELAQYMYKIYGKKRSLPQKEILDFYEGYNAFVMGYYFIYIKRPELVEYYFKFADKTFDRLDKFILND